jgi:heavy metal sensor kinase
MLSSLRARLLVWYTLILALVIVTFGGAVCYLYWRSLVMDVDEGLQGSAGALAEALRPAPSGDFDLVLPAEFRAGDPTAPETPTYYSVWNRDGELIDRSPGDFEVPLPTQPGVRTRDGRRELTIAGADGSFVLTGRDLSDVRRNVLGLAGATGAAGLAALLLSLAGGWFLAGRALAPVARISDAAAAMAAGDLTARIAVERTENELEQVASALNQAFDRLHLAVESERRFTADASHELRTPLATLSAEVEWALARDRPPDEYRRSLETIGRAAERMTRMVSRLLALARADTAAVPLERHPVALSAVVADTLSVLQPLAEQKHVTIESDLGAVTAVTVLGDRDRLTDLMTNLCSNAIQYNREGGTVRIDGWAENGDACIRVRDTGSGISAEDLPHVFERFYRADKARASHSGGAGLGLAIARSIVEAHGGRIAIESVVGRGTEVTVRLPRVA